METPQSSSSIASSLDTPPVPRLEAAHVVSSALASDPRFLVRTLFSAALPGKRQVTIYLPQAYTTEPARRFPVFYLHDGQNLFDPEAAYLPGHTWRAHTTADLQTSRGEMEPVILVGIDHTGQRRMSEYTPVPDPGLGGGEGIAYAQLLVNELKPILDHELRTLSGPADTGVGGSSLGGLISLYLGLERRDAFGKVAVISPSVWWDHRSILRRVRSANPVPELRIWLDMGTAEGLDHLRDTDQLYSLLLERGWRGDRDLAYLRCKGGLHNEDAWAARFGEVLAFLFPPSRPALAAHAALRD